MHSTTLCSALLVLVVCLSGLVRAQFGYGGHGLGILPGYGYGGPAYGSRLRFPSSPYGLGAYGANNNGGGGGSRLGIGYRGNGGIGIRQTDANLADLYGLPRALAQAPPPVPLQSVVPQVPQVPQFPGGGVGVGPSPYFGAGAGAAGLGGYGGGGLYGGGLRPYPGLLNGGAGAAHLGNPYLG